MAFTVQSFAYQEVLTYTKLNALQANDDYLKGILDGLDDAWTNYTPTLTVDSGTNPTNFPGTGRWTRLGGSTAKTLLAQFSFTASAGVTPGSGNYRISLPVTCVPSSITSGVARMFDSSTSSSFMDTRVGMAGASFISLQYSASHGGPIGNVGNATPWTWASGDIIDGFVICEIA